MKTRRALAVLAAAVALLLAVARRVPQATSSLKSGEWKRSKFTGVEITDKTMGVVGLGRIGVLVAQRMSAFGVRLLAYDPYVPPARAAQIGVRLVPLDDLLRESDFISTIKDYRIVMELSNVVVPAGKRPLLFQFNNYYVDANDDYGFISVFRSHTPGQSQQFPYWVVGTSQYNISSGSQSGILAGGLAAGTYNWSIQAHAKSDSGDRFELHGPMTFQILEL